MALEQPVRNYGEMSLEELASELRSRVSGDLPETGESLPPAEPQASAPVTSSGDLSAQRIAQTKAGLKTRLGKFETPSPTEDI